MIRSTQAWMKKVGPARYIWRMAWRQFVKRVLRRDLTLRLVNGREILLPRNSGFSSVAWVTNGQVDDGFEELLRWFAPAESVFFDVGAHFGFYSVYMADLHPVAVAFEPDARTLPALRHNLAGIKDAICIQAAVSDRVGSLRFVAAESSPQSRILTNDESNGADPTIEVDVTTLDTAWDVSGRPRVGSMKIDTEGHESAVLEGARQMIAQCLPQMLIEATAKSLAPHLEWLDQLGYKAVLLGERRYGYPQSLRIIELEDIGDLFSEGMILLLPPAARELPAWDKIRASAFFNSDSRTH